MKQLIPENATRKIDGLGRVTLPKGLRDRLSLSDLELELYTARIDGRDCICLALPINPEEEIEKAVELLMNRGKISDAQAREILG